MDSVPHSRSKPHYPQDTNIIAGDSNSRISQEGMLARSPTQQEHLQQDRQYQSSSPPYNGYQAPQSLHAPQYDAPPQLRSPNPVLHSANGSSNDQYLNSRPPGPETVPSFGFETHEEPVKKSRIPVAFKGKINKKWQKRLYWIVPLSILAIILVVLFEVYKSDFERWVKPLADWLKERDSWSWVIPTMILVILSFPPLFGHEIVQLIVGLTYPLGVALGIACAGAVLGEAACFVVFKYAFSNWVQKKIDTKVNWAATARVSQEAGFRGVLVIRYSIVPPHLANPLFACTGMKFWLYMATVILSLPKSMVFVALGTPSSEHSKGAKYAKVVAILVVVAITIFASMWIRRKMAVATREIESERGISTTDADEEVGMGMMDLSKTGVPVDTAYKGAGGSGYQGVPTTSTYVEQDIGASGPYRN